MGYDSEGSVYEPDSAPRAPPPRPAAASYPPPTPDYLASGAATPQGYGGETAVGTPVGSEPGEDTTAEATPAPEAPVKKSKALNFLKKKEPKTSINIKGTVYQIRDDEIVLPDDPRGEAKIDKDGNLLGGRRWKVHTFTSPLRANKSKVYLLSIDAARCAGFRDSLYFFRRNPLIHKLTCNQPEKDRLIELGRLSGNLKSRAVTMVSARNVFKVMGATFLQDGKYVFDDYYEDKSIAAGHKPGEPAFVEPYDPDKDTGTLATSKGNAPPGATSLGLNVLIGHPGKPKVPGGELISSGFGGGGIGGPAGAPATFGGTGLQPFGKAWDPAARKAKPAPHLTPENWMLEYADAVRGANVELGLARRANVGQVQVGLGVEEREEDCWEWVEEEYTDEEAEEAEEQKPLGMQLDYAANGAGGQSPYPQQQPQTSTAAAFDPSLPSLHGAVPNPHLPLGIGALPSLPLPPHSSFPSLPPTTAPGSASSSAPPTRPASPSPFPVAAAAAAPPKPKKKRMIRVYTPIRGVYEPETNVPHVYQATQPTWAEAEAVATAGTGGRRRGARIFDDDADEGEDAVVVNGAGESPAAAFAAKRRKLEDAAARAGVASVEIVSDERGWGLEYEGSSGVGVAGGEGGEAAGVEAWERARRGRPVPLVPGQWDFLGGEGMVA
ncbi:hypothetical protein JCM6882_008056 [Rhodosporidiobolus microsporus]